MRKFWKNHKGVTMVEVLVTVAILAIVVAPCLSAFVMAQRGNVKAAEAQAAYTAAANLMEELKGSQEKRDTVFSVEAPNGKKWVNSDKTMTLFYEESTNNADNVYYTVEIYVGDYSEDEVPEGVEPILKGVIAP